MSILEDNGVIATWMDYLFFYDDDGDVILGWRDYDVSGEVERVIYQPHKDWNQLMETVEKIENESHVDVSICHRSCIIHDFSKGMPNLATCAMARGSKIEAVYQAVLEYIKQQKEG